MTAATMLPVLALALAQPPAASSTTTVTITTTPAPASTPATAEDAAAANGWSPSPPPAAAPVPAPPPTVSREVVVVEPTPRPPKLRTSASYRSASAALWSGVGLTVVGGASLLLLTWPAYGLKQRALRDARGADDLLSEERYLDRAYRRDRVMWVSGIIGASVMGTGIILAITGGVARAVIRDSQRVYVEPTPDGIAIRF